MSCGYVGRDRERGTGMTGTAAHKMVPSCRVRKFLGFTFRRYSSGSWYLWGRRGRMLARYSSRPTDYEPQPRFKANVGPHLVVEWW